MIASLTTAIPRMSEFEEYSIGFFVEFFMSFGFGGGKKNIFAVITGMSRERGNYSKWELSGDLMKKSRFELAKSLGLPISLENNDSVGWFTFSARYSHSDRHGSINIEYSDERDHSSTLSRLRLD
jgi:hypothetical protein